MPRLHAILLLFMSLSAGAQTFETLPDGMFPGGKPGFSDITVTSSGTLLMGCSIGTCEIIGREMRILPAKSAWISPDGSQPSFGKSQNIYNDFFEGRSGITSIAEGPNHIIYVVDWNGNPGVYNHSLGMGIMVPPFDLPLAEGRKLSLSRVFLDPAGGLFMSTGSDVFFFVKDAAKIYEMPPAHPFSLSYWWGLDNDSNLVIQKGAKAALEVSLGQGIIPLTFSVDPDDSRVILIGTNSGIYAFDKISGEHLNYLANTDFNEVPVTDIYGTRFSSFLWFCSPTKGLGVYNELSKGIRYFPLQTGRKERTIPARKFSRLSDHEFLVATTDTLPGILDVSSGSWRFIDDSLFYDRSAGNSDIRLDGSGDLFLIREGKLYWSKNWMKSHDAGWKEDVKVAGPFITDVRVDDMPLALQRQLYLEVDSLREITLNPGEKKLDVYYDCRGVDHDSLVYAWTMDPSGRDWRAASLFPLAENSNSLTIQDLAPGEYVLRIRARNGAKPWLDQEVRLAIHVKAPYWKTTWFWALVSLIFLALLWAIIRWRENVVRRGERKRMEFEKRALELEARAMRAQMDPHFIFNCMNSIKSLIQQDKPEQAVAYLTTFAKLLRTVLDHSDKRDITLHEELETCRLYAELEVMRFGNRFRYQTEVEDSLDLKSIRVPALILQPFIENAIWHGLLPKEKDGLLSVEVKHVGEKIQCTIDDNGVGRHTGKKGTFSEDVLDHESKGIRMTRNRLDLDNALFQRKADLEILDKTDEKGQPSGTKIILTFSAY